MFKFFSAIVILQFVTVTITFIFIGHDDAWGWVKLIGVLLLVSALAAHWFTSLAENQIKDKFFALKEQFALEREEIRVKAERAKTRVVKQAQKQIVSETKRTTASANIKVGAAVAGTVGFAMLMLITELLTLGVMTLTTAGGALGGYLYRAKRENALRLENGSEISRTGRIINATKRLKIINPKKST